MSSEKKEKLSLLKRFASDMAYSLAALAVMNMVLSFGVYPYLERQLGADGQGKVLFFTALMGLMASAVGCGINYGRMKASTKHVTQSADYNWYLLAAAMLSILVTVGGFAVMPDAAGASFAGVCVLIFATTVRYYADVEYRLSLNYRGFFCYYMLIAAGYGVGMLLYPLTDSWISILLLGEFAGLLFVAVTGKLFRPPFFRRSENFGADGAICASLSATYIMSDFVSYADRLFLPLFVSNTASTHFYIASLIGKMTSLISTPLNGVITGHLARYNGKFTKRMLFTIMMGLLGFAALVTAATTVASHVYVYLFYPSEYRQVTELFLVANAGQVLFFLSNIMMTVVLRFASTRYQVVMGIGYLVVFFAAVLPAMYFFGLWGAAWGLLGVNLFKFLLITGLGFYALQRESKAGCEETADRKE